jgi:hypothetical protein
MGMLASLLWAATTQKPSRTPWRKTSVYAVVRQGVGNESPQRSSQRFDSRSQGATLARFTLEGFREYLRCYVYAMPRAQRKGAAADASVG